MTTYIVQEGQTLFDIALEKYGSVEFVYELLQVNYFGTFSASSQLTPMSDLSIPNTEGVGNEVNKRIIKSKGLIFTNEYR